MSMNLSFDETNRLDEPQAAQEYADVLTQVAANSRPVILRRNGRDLAAIIPLQDLELLEELRARHDLERRAAQIDWESAIKTHQPAQSWFEEEDNPFELAQEPEA
jgi:PHD/YefM family antitoxin component YafN of YafNO toxin-antitoxin module